MCVTGWGLYVLVPVYAGYRPGRRDALAHWATMYCRLPHAGVSYCPYSLRTRPLVPVSVPPYDSVTERSPRPPSGLSSGQRIFLRTFSSRPTIPVWSFVSSEQRMHLVFGDIPPWLHDVTSKDSCNTCRIAFLPAMSANEYLNFGHILDLVGTKKLEPVSS